MFVSDRPEEKRVAKRSGRYPRRKTVSGENIFQKVENNHFW